MSKAKPNTYHSNVDAVDVRRWQRWRRKSKLVAPLVILGLFGGGYFLIRSFAAGPIIAETFDGANGIITSNQYYQSASFPANGTSKSTNPSAVWEGDSGSFYRENNWGYSGRPIDWGNKYFFRFNTRNFNIKDAEIAWQYRSAPFGQDGYPVEGGDATDVWLRYQTQYNLYVWQFDRTNNCMQAKRKIPAQGWTGPASDIANKGVYYSLPTDANQPVFGSGQYCITWTGVQGLLPTGERSKPGFPNLAHDSTTIYDLKTVVKNLPDGKVQIQGYRAGVLVYSATDDGRSGIAADGKTQGQHLDAGYFNSVPGWQASWGKPITAPGASGFRADNIKFWLNNFTVTDLSTSPTQDTTKPVTAITAPLNSATVSAQTTVAADASDNVGVTKVEFLVDGVVKSTDTSAPYSWSWTTTSETNGTHTLSSRAYDAAGNTATSSVVTVSVANSTADTTPPTTPTGLRVSNQTANSITLTWQAGTDNVAVTGYRIFRYGPTTTSATVNALTFVDTGLAAGTKYQYTISSVDAAGNVSPQSAIIASATSALTNPPTSNISVTLTQNSSWSSGYCSSATIKNNGATSVSSWSVSTQTAGRVTSLWNAKWSQNSTNLTINNESWNGTLAPGQIYKDVGFCAATP